LADAFGPQLAAALQNRACANAGGGDLEGAIADYDGAIGIMEAIRDLMGDSWPVPMRNDLAMSFYNRALAERDAANPSAALADVAACLGIQLPLVFGLGPHCPPSYRAVLDDALRLRATLSDGPTRPA
jgi:hypothetical protein